MCVCNVVWLPFAVIATHGPLEAGDLVYMANIELANLCMNKNTGTRPVSSRIGVNT